MTTTLADRIAALGTTKDQIAETLRAAGIAAVQNEPCDCAIALWIQLGGFTGVSVGLSDDGYFVETYEYPDMQLGPSGPVVDFIVAFDHGLYPDLVERVAA